MEARSNLNDTRTLLFAKRDKLYRDAHDMHTLIEKAVGEHRNQAMAIKEGCPY